MVIVNNNNNLHVKIILFKKPIQNQLHGVIIIEKYLNILLGKDKVVKNVLVLIYYMIIKQFNVLNQNY